MERQWRTKVVWSICGCSGYRGKTLYKLQLYCWCWHQMRGVSYKVLNICLFLGKNKALVQWAISKLGLFLFYQLFGSTKLWMHPQFCPLEKTLSSFFPFLSKRSLWSFNGLIISCFFKTKHTVFHWLFTHKTDLFIYMCLFVSSDQH